MRIASFNAQRFGLKKVSDPEVLSALVKIVSRYDLILIVGVVDASGVSVQRFMTELNRVNTTHHYALQLSTRLGRNRYKEQFLFAYRDDVVDLIDCYQYEDNQENDMDVFAREPYIVDTTAATTNDHTFDRIVAYGEDMLGTIVPNSAKPFNFHKEFAMTEEMALRVSDHYPVEVELRGAPPFWMATSLQRRANVDTLQASVNSAVTGTLQDDMLKLQKENLLLEREKLQLQISLLKQQLATLK
uniref:Endonuclease/exonuclease/phosphatase domain-containing protein n=1 Tax=Amphiprion percula TaxID=161767 RepID=A0A3P8SQH8_AMPPE